MSNPSKSIRQSPWSDTPRELLQEARAQLEKKSETSLRVALILIDNTVEQSLKTYLGLPNRITKLNLPKKMRVAEMNFPSLLTTAEKFLPHDEGAVDYGLIEWFHRLRNSIYHDGASFAPRSAQVEVYFAVADNLIKLLFGDSDSANVETKKTYAEYVGEFLICWSKFEWTLAELYATTQDRPDRRIFAVRRMLETLLAEMVISEDQANVAQAAFTARNIILHGAEELTDDILAGEIHRLTKLTDEFNEILQSRKDN